MAKPNNVEIIYRTLIQGGLSPTQAAGVVGRFQQESGQGINTTAHGDRGIPGGSHGAGQWNRERLANLQAYGAHTGADWTDPRVQARFTLHEMGIGENNGAPGYGSESYAGQKLLASKSIEDAGISAMHYERPQGYTRELPTAGHGYRNTMNNAQAVFDLYGGTAGATDTSNPITDYSIGPKDATGQNEFWNPISPGGRGPGPKAPEPFVGGTGSPDTGNPISGYGGGPAGAKPPAKDDRTWLQKLAGGFGKGSGVAASAYGNAKMPAITPTPTTTRMTPGQAAPTLNPNTVNMQRQQMAQALARLNSGQLFLG
ncbi:MAG TPA: phage tail tip lysozyme [Chitinolyticbacter sp.]|nr:phage tail tip lysozyme [Chitinolyticbacter sp.]